MEKNNYIENQTVKLTNRSKHFVRFSVITIFLVVMVNFIFQGVNRGTTIWGIINIYALIEFAIMTIFVFRTYRTKELLSFRSKVVFMAGLVSVNYLVVITLYFMNPFSRIITMEDIREGIITSFLGSVLSLILSLPVIALQKNKTFANNT